MILLAEISLIDLVSYEGSKNESAVRPARELHASFSVKGACFGSIELIIILLS
jgi:hypothetical protein